MNHTAAFGRRVVQTMAGVGLKAPAVNLATKTTDLRYNRGQFSVESENKRMNGRFVWVTTLCPILGLDPAPEKVSSEAVSWDANLLMAEGKKVPAALERAAAYIRELLGRKDLVFAQVKQNCWKFYFHADWTGGYEVGMATALGSPNATKRLKAVCGAAFKRTSAMFGAVLVAKNLDVVKPRLVTTAVDEQAKLFSEQIANDPALEAAVLKGQPNASLEEALKKMAVAIHDGSLQFNGNYVMFLLFGPKWEQLWAKGRLKGLPKWSQNWRSEGNVPLPQGTVLKTVRLLVPDVGIWKGNAFVRWDMPKEVDIYGNTENFKTDWLPKVGMLIIQGVVDHSTALYSDRQAITMFEGWRHCYLRYVERFLSGVEEAIKSPTNDKLKELLNLAGEDEDEGVDLERVTFNTALNKLGRWSPYRFRILRSQIINRLYGGKKFADAITEGRVIVPQEFGGRGYVYADPAGWMPGSGYYSLSLAVLKAGEAVVSGREYAEPTLAAIIRSPHANPWEISVINLLSCSLSTRYYSAVGCVYVNAFDMVAVLKRAGGGDLDDQVGYLTDPEFVKYATPNRPEGIPVDSKLIDEYTKKDEPPRPADEVISWKSILEYQLHLFTNQQVGVIGGWATTVSRYLPVYQWLDRLYKRLLSLTSDEAVASELGLKQEAVPAAKAVIEKLRAGTISEEERAQLLSHVNSDVSVALGVNDPEHRSITKMMTDAGANIFRSRAIAARCGQITCSVTYWNGRRLITEEWPLSYVLAGLETLRPVYNVLLEPFFGEEYIDASQGMDKGAHHIIALFKQINTRLKMFMVGESCCFDGIANRLAFGLTPLFLGKWSLAAFEPGTSEVKVVSGEPVLQNTVLDSTFDSKRSMLVSRWFEYVTGKAKTFTSILPKAPNAKGEMKSVAWLETDEEFKVTKNVNLFFRWVWAPAVERWIKSGEITKMVPALYLTVKRWMEDAEPGCYEKVRQASNFTKALAAYAPDQFGKMVGAINLSKLSKADTVHHAWTKRESGMPGLCLPEDWTPGEAEYVQAKAMLLLYQVACLADAQFRVRGEERVLHSGVDVFARFVTPQPPRDENRLQMVKGTAGKIVAEAIRELAAQAPDAPEISALRELVLGGPQSFAFDVLDHEGIVNDRLLWDGKMGVLTAVLLKFCGKDLGPTQPSPDNDPTPFVEQDVDFSDLGMELPSQWADMIGEDPEMDPSWFEPTVDVDSSNEPVAEAEEIEAPPATEAPTTSSTTTPKEAPKPAPEQEKAKEADNGRVPVFSDLAILRCRQDCETFVYTDGQFKALQMVQETIDDKAPRKVSVVAIDGAAGVGKTTIIPNIVNYATYMGMGVGVAAITNKAVNVARRKLREQGVRGVVTSTLHRLLYDPPKPRRKMSEEEKKEKLEFNKKLVVINNAVIIVDEASMLTKDIERTLFDACGRNCVVVFVGDHNQLEAIGKPANVLEDRKSADFDWKYIRLEEVKRVALESSVLVMATALRSRKMSAVPPAGEYKDVASCATTTEVENRAKSAILAEKDAVLVTGTNKRRVSFNDSVRFAKYGKNAKPALSGDRLISISNSQFFSNGETFSIEKATILCEAVAHIENDKKSVDEKIVVLAANVTYNGDRADDVKIILLPSTEQASVTSQMFEDALNEVDQTGELATRCEDLRKALVDFTEIRYSKSGDAIAALLPGVVIATYGYAITCHKSQGSQWDEVFVTGTWFPESWTVYRWLYTAITRSASKVTVHSNFAGTNNQPTYVATWDRFVAIANEEAESKATNGVKANGPMIDIYSDDSEEI